MGGIEHYAEAQRLLEVAEQYVSRDFGSQTGEEKADILAAAQVHATLALAAATAMVGLPREFADETRWRNAVTS